MSATPNKPASKTNSIEIFIDADGGVTFSDLPSELQEVVSALTVREAETATASWCELYPQSPESPDQPD